MTLSEYSDIESDATYTRWLESRTEQLGSIWGGSVFVKIDDASMNMGQADLWRSRGLCEAPVGLSATLLTGSQSRT